jgi:hypothetical protein
MLCSPRFLTTTFLSMVLLLLTGTIYAHAQRGIPSHPAPKPMPSPNTPDGNFPSGLKGPRPKEADAKSMDRQNQEQVKADVEKLYALVSELREQVQKSDVSSTLSVSVVKKAQQIEKLAKQVKDRAKG